MVEQKVKVEDLPCSQATTGPTYCRELLDMDPSVDTTPCIRANVEVRCQGMSHFLLFALHLYPLRELHSILFKSGLWIQVPASLSFSQMSYLLHISFLLSLWVDKSQVIYIGLGGRWCCSKCLSSSSWDKEVNPGMSPS